MRKALALSLLAVLLGGCASDPADRDISGTWINQAAIDAAAKGGYLIAGAHLPFPGMGHLQIQGKGYRWIPVNYTRMP